MVVSERWILPRFYPIGTRFDPKGERADARRSGRNHDIGRE
jgi:hypothetical protein